MRRHPWGTTAVLVALCCAPVLLAVAEALAQSAPEPPGPGELTVASYNLRFRVPTAEANAAASVRACSILNGLGAPDIVGLQEVGSEEALNRLTSTLATFAAGSPDPLVSDARYGAEIRGNSSEKLAVLYRMERVKLLSLDERQTCIASPIPGHGGDCSLPDECGYDLYDRPPAVARIEVKATGGRLNLIVDHWKAGEGRDERALRELMAEHNVALARELRRTEPDVPVFVLGDLNDVPGSPPIATLVAGAPLFDPFTTVPTESAYTIRRGTTTSGLPMVFDYILVPTEQPIRAFGPRHLNVDYATVEPGKMSLACPPRATPQPASDHDPVLMRIPVPFPLKYLPIAVRRVSVDEIASPPTAVRVPPTATAKPPPAWPFEIITVLFDGTGSRGLGEYVEFRSVSTHAIDLAGWRIGSLLGRPAVFRFADASTTPTVIAPGTTCRLYTNVAQATPAPTGCVFDWESNVAIWRNDGDVAEIRDPHCAVVDRYCYGNGCATPTPSGP